VLSHKGAWLGMQDCAFGTSPFYLKQTAFGISVHVIGIFSYCHRMSFHGNTSSTPRSQSRGSVHLQSKDVLAWFGNYTAPKLHQGICISSHDVMSDG